MENFTFKKIGKLKNSMLTSMKCSKAYLEEVNKFRKANDVTYAEMVRYAFDKVYKIDKSL